MRLTSRQGIPQLNRCPPVTLRLCQPPTGTLVKDVSGSHRSMRGQYGYPETFPVHLRPLLGVTYEVGLREGVTSPYAPLRQFVVSHTMRESPDASVALHRGDPLALVRGLKGGPGKDIWLCGGSKLAAAVVPEIDEVILKINPVVIGTGIPLLSGFTGTLRAALIDSKAYGNGFVLRVTHCRPGPRSPLLARKLRHLVAEPADHGADPAGLRRSGRTESERIHKAVDHVEQETDIESLARRLLADTGIQQRPRGIGVHGIGPHGHQLQVVEHRADLGAHRRPAAVLHHRADQAAAQLELRDRGVGSGSESTGVELGHEGREQLNLAAAPVACLPHALVHASGPEAAEGLSGRDHQHGSGMAAGGQTHEEVGQPLNRAEQAGQVESHRRTCSSASKPRDRRWSPAWMAVATVAS
ncbi:MAG: hypothetical protein FJW39_34100 [Acidobacteria bacterium]|nr:hypothetical protein [Acidobacteriota bacterium]